MGKINYSLLNTSALNASRLNMTGETGKSGGGAGGYWPDGTPAAIRRSAVLWYDIAKQGATNETMAENPVLKDLSGHGHDATCYNFGWTEESGISTENYPGALVSDGVDDYGYVEGLPLLTKERGFTVMAARKQLSEGINQGFATKAETASSWAGSFVLEGIEGGGGAHMNRSFDKATYVFYFEPSDFIYLTSNSYCGNALSGIGDAVDNDRMALFTLSLNRSFFGRYALYSFILFDRDLTDEEIEWVKNNLIENNTEE